MIRYSLGNFFEGLPSADIDEVFEALADNGDVTIERIVTRGQSTMEGEWYDQPRREWVILLRGSAHVKFFDGHLAVLGPGDWLDIPAHCRHRVEWSDPDDDTVWLAIHFHG